MKHIIYILIFLVLQVKMVSSPTRENNGSALIRQEIRYNNPEAKEVFLVWGVNNWNIIDEKNFPPGTYIKDKLMYTPMNIANGVFSVALNVESNSVVDYVFWITKGPRNANTDVWDKNKAPLKDYHTMAMPNSTVTVDSDVKVRPVEMLSLLDFSWHLLILVCVLYLIFYFVKRYVYSHMIIRRGPLTIIISAALTVLVMLFLIRPAILGISWDIYLHPLSYARQFLWMGFYDLVYVCVLTLIFTLLVMPFRKFPALQLGFTYLFVGISLFSMVAGIVNVRIVQILGKPFTYQWLYYSDFLRSIDSKVALTANVSVSYITNVIVVSLAAIICASFMISVIGLMINNQRVRKALLVLLTFISVSYLVITKEALAKQEWNYDKLSNPVAAFLESVNPFAPNPSLFTMEVEDSLRTFDKKNKEPAFSGRRSDQVTGIKNVIIYVLESTPAEYVQAYGGKYFVTPEIEKQISNSIVFENIYAHAPATNMSMVSLLGSVYPWLSYNSITEKHPDIKIPTISSELKTRGYRTAFFNSADNRFQKGDEFLANRKFDNITDCRNSQCDRSNFEVKDDKWNYLNGKDDECTAEELCNWIEQDKSKPFFALVWTYQTHYPYFYQGTQEKYDLSNEFLNRYLNALKHSDEALGKIIEHLKKNSLFDSTLVLVIGDHGEAFGDHDQITHARKIYEENLHVPCIMINPLFNRERKFEIGGLIDIAPTVMNLLGFSSPENWQGSDLFTKKDNRVYFFAPWSDYLFGYREGNEKYIYNATLNTTEIYDLKKDPEETQNIAAKYPGKVKLCHKRLAAWTQFVNRFIDSTLNPQPETRLAAKK